MMKSISAAQIGDLLEEWLTAVDSPLHQAVERTIVEGLFRAGDVHFAVNHLRDSVLDGQPQNWLGEVHKEKSNQLYSSKEVTQPQNSLGEVQNEKNALRTILCLHAGNLPLVGFQDVLAVLLSGSGYAGKLSRKDPYLLKSFIDVIKKRHSKSRVQCCVDINTFKNRQFAEWMFAGSEGSLKKLEHDLLSRQIIVPQHKALRRTAHFSAAVLNERTEPCINDLIESILRYGGKGCRSVALVYSHTSLGGMGPQLIEKAADWYRANGFSPEIPPFVRYRKAYNDAVGIPSVLLGTHLLQAGVPSPDHPEIVYWQEHQNPIQIRMNYSGMLQEVYGCGEGEFTALGQAQRPPIDWKPDGVDTLRWIFDSK